MARGHERHRARKEDVAELGKALVRRSGARCELCHVRGESLTPVEIAPYPEHPDADHAVLICSQCQEGVEEGRLDAVRWRFLESVIWTDIPAVQVAAVRICRRLAADDCVWAGELLENLYLNPEIEAWVGE